MRTFGFMKLGNLLLGFLAVFSVLRAELAFASFLILWAVAEDLVYRFLTRKEELLDTEHRMSAAANMLSFGVAPALLAYSMFSGLLEEPLFGLALPVILVAAAAVKFSRQPHAQFNGLPIAANGLVIPLLFLTNLSTLAVLSGWLILSSALMVFTFSVRKKNKEVVLGEEEEKESPVQPLGFLFGGD